MERLLPQSISIMSDTKCEADGCSLHAFCESSKWRKLDEPLWKPWCVSSTCEFVTNISSRSKAKAKLPKSAAEYSAAPCMEKICRVTLSYCCGCEIIGISRVSRGNHPSSNNTGRLKVLLIPCAIYKHTDSQWSSTIGIRNIQIYPLFGLSSLSCYIIRLARNRAAKDDTF
jgi:hypothetical protein